MTQRCLKATAGGFRRHDRHPPHRRERALAGKVQVSIGMAAKLRASVGPPCNWQGPEIEQEE